jgi:hypothetical protein
MKGQIMITNLIKTKAHHKTCQHNWFAPLFLAALIAFPPTHAQASFLDKIVKVERKGDSVGVSVNPLGIFGGDKKPDDRSNSPAGALEQGAAESPIISPVQNQNVGFTQATLPDGAIHLAFVDTPEWRTAKNTRGLSNLPVFTELTGGKTYFSSSEVRNFILVHHGFLPASAATDPIGYLIAESHTERMRSLNMNQFENRDEAPRVREKFRMGLEQAKGIERGVVFAWTAWAGSYDFVSKGCHFSSSGWPGGIFINGVEVSSVFFPVPEAEMRASVKRNTDYFIMKFEGRIMDKSELREESRTINASIPLAVSNVSLYLVRRRDNNKIVPEIWGRLAFDSQRATPLAASPGENLPTSATKEKISQNIVCEHAVSTLPSISSPNQAQTEQTSSDHATASLTPREVVESAAWAEFKKTWRREGESWITSKWVNPRGVFEQKTFQWMVSNDLVSDRGCELKNLRNEVEEQTLSDLQKLNGITARWTVTFTTQYYRLKSPAGWSKWNEPQWSVLFLVFESKDGGRPTMLNATPVWKP